MVHSNKQIVDRLSGLWNLMEHLDALQGVSDDSLPENAPNGQFLITFITDAIGTMIGDLNKGESPNSWRADEIITTDDVKNMILQINKAWIEED